MNVALLLEEKTLRSPDKPAFIFRGENITFRQLRDRVFTLAAYFKKQGVKPGDAIAIYLPGWPEYVYSYLAVWTCGATAVPLDFMLTQDELASCLRHSQARILVAKEKANLDLAQLKNQCPSLQEFLVCPKAEGEPLSEVALSLGSILSRTEKLSFSPSINEKSTAIIFYTSGTTGAPKGVLINYLQLNAPPQSMEFYVDLKENDIALCALPFSHLGGLIYIQNCITYGITVVLMERFVPLEFLKNIQQYKVTCFWIVPSMYYAFLQLKEFESLDLSSLRWMVTFGASNSPEALRRFHRFCPHAHLVNGWGLTETNAPTTVIPLGSLKIESVGRPAPWIEVKVFDDRDREVSGGTTGEVVVRGWVVTDGYFKDAELTAQVMKNGWFHTGDLGKKDAEGDLYIVGRKKEMIKVAGEIVFEPEVETALQKHPAVAEAAVIGVADKLRGEVPKAFLVCKPGQQVTEEELRYFCRQHLAHFKVPHYFEFVAALPKNRIGKVAKEVLRQPSAYEKRP